jgi:rhamnogalacturonyl hydrolase YesR
MRTFAKLLVLLMVFGGSISATVKPHCKKNVLIKADILKLLHQTAIYNTTRKFDSLPRWNENKRYDWVEGTYFAGLSEFYKYTKEKKYLDEMIKVGVECNWEPRGRPYDMNEYAIIQTYCDLYEATGNFYMIDKSAFMAKMPFIRYVKPDIKTINNPYVDEWWSWCDGLFMGPPAYARLGKLLNDKRYWDYMNENWWRTSDYLYNKKDSLFYRDDQRFSQRTANGNNVYWARGNGWVIGGLCRTMDYLPKEYPTRLRFEQQFKEMMLKLAKLQTAEGFWPPSLLDYNQYPFKESSGTAFYCYGFAWGINNGLLDKEKYLPVVVKAWNFLLSCRLPNGALGFVQPIGGEPDNVKAEDTQAYGEGAFLMAGTEILKLLDKVSTAN